MTTLEELNQREQEEIQLVWERYERSFAKAEAIVSTWPKWKKEYRLTKHCGADMAAK